jgi:histidyl-tRNA synthetase
MTDEPTTPASGMRDFLPDQVARRNYVFDIIRDVYEGYGFEPLETPSMERLSTLLGKYGEDEKLIFRIMKRGEKLQRALDDDPSEDELADLALRYDLTVPLARIFAEHGHEFPRVFKRYQIGPVWRADRPQKGRYREFYQCDVDILGSESTLVEAEVISAAADALERLGFEDFRIHANHRKLLDGMMEVAGIEEEMRSEALIAIDKLDKIGLKGVVDELDERGLSDDAVDTLMPLLDQGAEADTPPFDNARILDAIADQVGQTDSGGRAISDLETLFDVCEHNSAGRHLYFDPYLARGLSYYTGSIFEIRSDDFPGSLAAGGRYDDLVGMFTNQDVPACGFSLGVERIIDLMDDRDMFDIDETPADVMVAVWNEEFAADSMAIARQMREAGLRADLFPDVDSGFGKQFGYADDRDIPFVAIFAPDEKEAGSVAIRDMESGEQTEVSREHAGEETARLILKARD